jgi:hypothetical protein
MLPITTTTIRIERPNIGLDPYEDVVHTIVYDNVPGVVSVAAGSDVRVGGDQQTLLAELHIDPRYDLQRSDRVIDNTTGEMWIVTWVRRRYELGLEYTKAGLTRTEGAADGG